jgi:hypothetical protein
MEIPCQESRDQKKAWVTSLIPKGKMDLRKMVFKENSI